MEEDFVVGTVPLDSVEAAEAVGSEFSDFELVCALRRSSLKNGMVY